MKPVHMVLFLAGCLFAQDKIHMEDALQLAEKNNPILKRQQSIVKAAQATRLQGIDLPNPHIGWFKEGIESGSDQFAETRQYVSQFIPNPFSMYYAIKSNSSLSRAAEDSLAGLHASLRNSVKKAYIELIHRKKIRSLYESTKDNANRLNEVTQERTQAGDASEIDLTQTELSLLEAENTFELADNDVLLARYKLFGLMGIDPDEQNYSTEFDDSLGFKIPEHDQKYFLAEMMNLPTFKTGENQLKAANYSVNRYRSNFFEGINLSYYRQDYGTGFDYYGIDLSVSVPLNFGSNQRPLLQQAKAQRNIVRAEESLKLLHEKEKLERIWHQYEKNLEIIRRYEQKGLLQARKLLDSATEGYRVGEMSLLVLLRAQSSFITIQIGYFNALKELYISLVDLENYSGESYVLSTNR